jgi:hypothetical protein
VAGGGVHGGRIVGASDAKAAYVADRPVTPADLAATIHHALGISSEQAQTLGLAVPGQVVGELF